MIYILPLLIALCFTIFIFVCVTAFFIVKKENAKGYIVPYALWTLAGLFLIYAKFSADALLLLPILLLYMVSAIGMVVRLIVDIVKKKSSRRKIGGVAFCVALTILLLSIPFMSNIDRFYLYKNTYAVVADAFFQAYDQSTLDDKNFFVIAYDDEQMTTMLSQTAMRDVHALSNHIDVWKIIVDENEVYFFFGGQFQSIDGIVVTRDGTIDPLDNAFLSHYMQSPAFTKLEGNCYYFDGGI